MGGWLRIVREGIKYEAQVDLRTWLVGVSYSRMQVPPSPARHILQGFVGCFRFSRDWSVKAEPRLTYMDAIMVCLIGALASIIGWVFA